MFGMPPSALVSSELDSGEKTKKKKDRDRTKEKKERRREREKQKEAQAHPVGAVADMSIKTDAALLSAVDSTSQ
ncbi:unnamed protein product, partial [Gongylonema pulchrum]|uniref:BLVR domain-containing protein n=1 Tax=Gongylonema pulchrum TaxID=637853 RepID=A0A183EUF7_9BILA